MQWFLTVVYSFVCVMLILVVLLQRGKDASGNIFGTGSNALLSSHGTTSFLIKLTTSLAVMFFLLGMTMNYLINHGKAGIASDDLLKDEPGLEMVAEKEDVAGQMGMDQKALLAAGTGAEKAAIDVASADGVLEKLESLVEEQKTGTVIEAQSNTAKLVKKNEKSSKQGLSPAAAKKSKSSVAGRVV